MRQAGDHHFLLMLFGKEKVSSSMRLVLLRGLIQARSEQAGILIVTGPGWAGDLSLPFLSGNSVGWAVGRALEEFQA